MVAVLKGLLVRMAATAGKAFLTRKFLLWLVGLAAQQTETLIDDHGVKLVDALLNGNVDDAITHGKAMMNALAELKANESQGV